MALARSAGRSYGLCRWLSTVGTGSTQVSAVVGGASEMSLEAGRLAHLADGSVVASFGSTKVLTTAVSERKLDETQSMLPLHVEYREKASATGTIPATFTRREGRPQDREVLISRLIDRSIRPLFPKGFFYSTQIMSTVLSADHSQDPDILCINAASAALSISSIPFWGPVGAVRVALVDGEHVVNPSAELVDRADLTLIYSGTSTRPVMIEAQGDGSTSPTKAFKAALQVAQHSVERIIPMQRELVSKLGNEKRQPVYQMPSDQVLTKVEEHFAPRARQVFEKGGQFFGKADRHEALHIEQDKTVETLTAEGIAEKGPALDAAMAKVTKATMHDVVLKQGKRPDGRSINELRPLSCEYGVLPHVHGSALFQRGDTQMLSTVAVGGLEDAQKLVGIAGPDYKRLIVHYSFPPFCINETGKSSFVSRREVGHGALAERALSSMIPSEKELPFSVRVSSETLSSNGSSSMAAVCSGSLALMDAGVPISEHIAGVSVGLLMDENKETGEVERYMLPVDIQGVEDGLGDMDFKVAGTARGVTAIQLDCKPAGIPLEILFEALDKASDARMEILNSMEKAISTPRSTFKESAPRFGSTTVPKEILGRIIGSGGSNIKELEQCTGCRITVENTGRVSVFGPTKTHYMDAMERIRQIRVANEEAATKTK